MYNSKDHREALTRAAIGQKLKRDATAGFWGLLLVLEMFLHICSIASGFTPRLIVPSSSTPRTIAPPSRLRKAHTVSYKLLGTSFQARLYSKVRVSRPLSNMFSSCSVMWLLLWLILFIVYFFSPPKGCRSLGEGVFL